MNIIFKILRYLKKKENLILTVLLVILMITNIVTLATMNGYKDLYEEQFNKNSTNEEIISNLKAENDFLVEDAKEHDKYMKIKDDEIIKLQDELDKLKNPQIPASSMSGTEQAEYVWDFLIDKGINIFVAAGIMGNIMAEVGGQSLDISRWPTYSKGNYYGICQWSGGRKSRLLNNYGKTLEAQVKFLYDEMLEVIPKDSDFYSLEDEKAAALYFAKHYERCSSKYYSIRQSNATKALKHFVG